MKKLRTKKSLEGLPNLSESSREEERMDEMRYAWIENEKGSVHLNEHLIMHK
jgi:hypothetical protein